MEDDSYSEDFLVKWLEEVTEKVKSVLIHKDLRSKKIDELIKQTSLHRKELHEEIKDMFLQRVFMSKSNYNYRVKEIEKEYENNKYKMYKRCSEDINDDVNSVIWHLDKIKEQLKIYSEIYTITPKN